MLHRLWCLQVALFKILAIVKKHGVASLLLGLILVRMQNQIELS